MQFRGRMWRGVYLLVVCACLVFSADSFAQLTLVSEWNIPLPESVDRRKQVVGNREYRAAGTVGLQVFDVSNPSQPTILGTYRDPLGRALALVVTNDLAFVAYGERELQIINVTNPTNMFRVSGFYAAGGGGYGRGAFATDLALERELVYLADGFSGLQIVNVSEPSNPVSAGIYPTPQAAVKVTVKGTNATVLADVNIYILDVSNPGAPRLVTTTLAIPRMSCIAVNGTTVVAGCDFRGVEVSDVSDPATPVSVGSISFDTYLNDVAIQGTTVLAANYSAGARVVDVSDPTKPRLNATFPTEGNSFGVALAGTRGYVLGGRDLYVLDLRNSEQPQLLGRYQSATFMYKLSIEGNHAFLAREDGRTEIVNIADPANLNLVGTIPSVAHVCTVRAGIAYLGTTTGLQIFNVADPTQPQLVGSSAQPTAAIRRTIAVSGSHVYMNDNNWALAVFELDQEYSPTRIATYPPASSTGHLAADENHVFLADYHGGLKIYRNENSGLRLKPSPTSGTPHLTVLNATPGSRYILESASNLATVSWSPLATNTVQNYSGTFSANQIVGEGSFFRLRVDAPPGNSPIQ